jgi:hypothetical protein
MSLSIEVEEEGLSVGGLTWRGPTAREAVTPPTSGDVPSAVCGRLVINAGDLQRQPAFQLRQRERRALFRSIVGPLRDIGEGRAGCRWTAPIIHVGDTPRRHSWTIAAAAPSWVSRG